MHACKHIPCRHTQTHMQQQHSKRAHLCTILTQLHACPHALAHIHTHTIPCTSGKSLSDIWNLCLSDAISVLLCSALPSLSILLFLLPPPSSFPFFVFLITPSPAHSGDIYVSSNLPHYELLEICRTPPIPVIRMLSHKAETL